ncbi:MAG: 3-demethylubiquinone-9 3-methyltransferase [Bacteroidetes bacterium]|nr:3-demethylubiquinone-9 3-methyltransferase [Bacteroidota bacterium]
MSDKITPTLWYHTEDGKMKQVTDYYSKIFGSDFEAETPISLGETPSGYAEMGYVKFFGDPLLIMTTEKVHQKMNDTFSIMIHCDDQPEIDKFWDYFTSEGEESMCGWCIDKFGLRWQIIPKNFNELMSYPNAGEIMMKQRKIIISEYLFQ